MGETRPFKNLHSREYTGHKKKVHSVAWNCTRLKLAPGSVDQTARVWRIEPHGGKCSQQAELSGESINITYKPDGTLIAVGNRDDELTILDVRKFKPIHRRKFSYEVNEDCFEHDRGNVLFDNWKCTGIPSLRPLDTVMAHTAGCYCIAIDPVGRYFDVGSADSLVSLWDISEMLCVQTFTKLGWPVRTISFNYTGDYIASASADLFIDIAFSEYLASASRMHEIREWEEL